MTNYYRTRQVNFDLEKDLPREYNPRLPKLLVIPTADPAIPLSLSANVEKDFKGIEVIKLEGLCGHWVQLEKPAEVEKVVGEWVEKQVTKGWTV
jgi:pimeloyl-ACP methyl ester carboxylesterase